MTWMNEWVNERMHVMTWNDMKWHEMTWMNERTDCLMSELPAWATSSLCDLFAAAPPLSAAASLSSFLSGLRLPWTASGYLFCSFCNPILFLAQLALCFLQPPAAIPHSRTMAASLTLSCAQPCHRNCHSQLQTGIAGASRQIQQRLRSWQWRRFRAMRYSEWLSLFTFFSRMR